MRSFGSKATSDQVHILALAVGSLASLICVTGFACEALAAKLLHPHGHAEISYDASTSNGVPSTIAKVIALGSMAPDFYEFDQPAAHAQIPNPPLNPGNSGCSSFNKDAFQREKAEAHFGAQQWHEFYLQSAIDAMNHGQRERAAFLLGYALHNVEDHATHNGIPDILHAALDGLHKTPDLDRDRLKKAHELARLDLETFRSQIGENNWRLFRGEVLHISSQETVIPEPSVLEGDLEDWNPRSGGLPVSHYATEPAVSAPHLAESLVNLMQEFANFHAPGAAISDDVKIHTKMVADWFLKGMYSRHERMHKILASNYDQKLAEWAHEPMNNSRVWRYKRVEPMDSHRMMYLVFYGISFLRPSLNLLRDNSMPVLDWLVPCLSCSYYRLCQSDQKAVGEINWQPYDENLVLQLKNQRQALLESAQTWIAKETAAENSIRYFTDHRRLLPTLTRPHKDATPEEPPPPSDEFTFPVPHFSQQKKAVWSTITSPGRLNIPSSCGQLFTCRPPNWDGLRR